MFKIHKLADHLAGLNDAEVEKLVKIIRERFGKSPFYKNVIDNMFKGPGDGSKLIEPIESEFVEIILISYGEYKLQVLKEVKEEFDLSLFDAKQLIDNVPCRLGKSEHPGYHFEYAIRVKELLESKGARVELKPLYL